MMRIIEFLYYCLFRMFALIKRKGERDENLAASFYAILLTTNLLMLSLPLKFVIPKGVLLAFPYSILIKTFILSCFFLMYHICKYFFLKKKHYLRVIPYYESKYEGKNKQLAFIGILYMVLTFGSFITLITWISRI